MNAVITGGTKGIGRAIAQLFYSKGINIAICSRNQEDLISITEELKSTNSDAQVISLVCDVSKKMEVHQFAQHVIDHFETIDILVNNAGVFYPGSLLEEEEGNLEHLIETNLYSAYHLTRKIAPTMVKQGGGHIFNMCSIASIAAYANGGSYAISKFALLGFSKGLRAELQDKNVKVTAILPGATWSNSWAGASFPEERLMEAEDIALTIWNALQLSPSAVVEEIIIRPQLGDL